MEIGLKMRCVVVKLLNQIEVKMKTFIDLCISGDAFDDEIDDFIERWHEGEGEHLELHEYLGMNEDEYSLWLKCPKELATIISAKRGNIPLLQAMNDEIYALAARADKADQILKIKAWLKEKGKE